MSFIKGLFIKDDGLPQVKPETTAQKIATFQPSVPTSIASQFTTPSPAATTAEINEFTEFLNEVYKKGDFPGPDYQEFTTALKAIESAPMDEKTKFTTIFTAFSVQGVTKKRLLETGDKYIAMINSQVSDFTKEIDNMMSGEIAGKQKEVAKINQENLDIEKQMQLLVDKKNTNSVKINQMSAEINEQVGGLNSKKSSFELAANNFTGHVKTNIEKIKLYLPE